MFRGFPELGAPSCGPYNKAYSILGSILFLSHRQASLSIDLAISDMFEEADRLLSS